MNKKTLFLIIFLGIGFGIWCSNHLTYNFTVDPLTFGTEIQKQEYVKYKNAFSKNKEAITIGLKMNSKVFEYSDFLSVQKLTSSVKNLQGVEKVVSIENIRVPSLNGFQISNPLFLPLSSGIEFQKKYKELYKFHDITEKFLSKDRASLSFYVYLNDSDTPQTISSIKTLLKNSSFDEYHILGSPVFESEGNDVLEQETFLIALLGSLLLLICMILLTPSFNRIFITILFTVFNVCVTLVFMYVFNFEVTSFTTMIPSIIAILSFTDITHILYHYELLVSEQTPKLELQSKLFKKIGFPLVLTSISNLFGFVIFFFNGGVHQITDLAIVATFGIVFAYLSSRLLLPKLLNYKVPLKTNRTKPFVELVISRCVDFVSLQYKRIIIGFAILFLALLTEVVNDTKINMQYYEKENTSLAINKACAFYDENFQGIRDIEVVIKSKKENILTSTTTKVIDSIENYLRTDYGCKTTFSVNTIIKRYQRFKRNGNPNAYKMPKNISADLFKELRSNEKELSLLSVVSQDQRTTRIIGSLSDIGANEALTKNIELEKFLSIFHSENFQIYLNGRAFIFDQNVFYITRFVLFSLFLGILITGVLVTLLFKSVWIGITAVLANLLPLLFGIVMMTFLGMDLNPSSIFILTILFGVALDDSIYLLAHLYNSDPQKSYCKTILIKSLKTNSSPLLITTLVLSSMFLALTISSYDSLATFGLIVSSSLIFAFVSDLFLIPSLLLFKNNNMTT